MSDQKHLFDPPAPTGNLTDRQHLAYRTLVTNARDGGGSTADEIGALLHAQKGKHTIDKRCNWCAADGQGVLEALRAKGLAKNSRARGWIPLQAPEADEVDPATSQIPY